MDAYQERANECLEFAKTSREIGERTTWRELALCWLRLSEHAEEFRARAKWPTRPLRPQDLETRR
jgi:hypothetical protein